MVIDIFKYLIPKEEAEEEEEKFQIAYKKMATKMNLSLDPDDPLHYYDWRGLFEETGSLTPDKEGHFPSKYKKEGHPRMTVGGVSTKTGEIDLNKYIFPKGEITKEEPDPFDALNESIEKDYKKYQSLTKKLEAYQAEYDYAPDNIKPTIAANFNKLVEEQGALVKQLQSEIKERDWVIGTKYKDAFMKFKQLTGLPGDETFKPTPISRPKPIIEGLPISPIEKPKTFLEKAKEGVVGVFGTWEAKKRVMPELQKMEDFANTVVSEAVPLAQSRYGEDYNKRGSYKEEIAVIHEYLTGAPRLETLDKMDANFKKYKNINPDVDERTWLEYYKQEGLWKTLITGPTKGIYDEAEKLQRQLSDIRMRVAEPGKDFIGQVGWTGVAIVLGYQGISALYKGGMTIENKVIKGEKLKQAVKRIQDAYIKETGKFKDTLSNNDFRIAEALGQVTKKYGSEILTGLTKMEVPQEMFMLRGQAGNIANIVKMIQSAGKLTPDISNQLKVMNPVDTGLVFQQLSIASPAIAEKIASEFVKLIPQEIKKIPKVEEEMTPEEAEAFERLKKEKIVPIKEVEPTKADLEGIERLEAPIPKELEPLAEIAREYESYPKWFEDLYKDAMLREKYDPLILKAGFEDFEDFYNQVTKVKPKEYVSAPKSARTFRAERRIEQRADNIGLLAKFNYEKKIWEVWEVEDPKAFVKELTKKVYEGRKVEEFLKSYKVKPIEEIEPTKAELEAIEKPITPKKEFEEAFKVGKAKVEVPEKVEPEPTPEEIRKVFMDKEHLETTVKNREFFLGKFGKLFTETKAAEDILIKQKFNEMNMMVEYEEDKVFKLAFGKEKMRVPETTKTEWIEGLGKSRYMQIFRKDSNLQYPDEIASNLGISENELRDQIIERIRTAPREVTLESAKQELIDEGNAVFLQVDAQMDAYRILLDEIEGGEYSFDTPKNVKRLNDKISSLKRDSKKLMAQYEEKITAIQKEGIEKRFEELKKITEAEKKVEVEIGIKKGLKVAKAELKGRAIKGMPEKEIKEGNKLIKEIQIMVKNRGFTKKQFSDIKMTKGGARSLSGKTRRMTIPQLKAVLRAVELARPRKIGAKQVVSLKTENKIQSLKDTLIEEQQMNEKRYEEILKEEGIYKEPKYIDAIHFITEKQGKKLIYRLLNESNLLKITEPYRRAREAHPELKKVWDKLHKRNILDPDKTLRDPHDLQSMRRVIQKAGRITGADFYPVYRSLIDTNLECRHDLHNFIKDFDKHKGVIKDKERLKVAESWILAKSNLEDKPEIPEDITKEEIAFAKDFEAVLKDYQPTARTQKFLDNIENLEKMEQYNQYRKEINKAKDIFESKGLNALEEYMKDQKWGIITSGYDPMQVISPKVRAYTSSPLVFGKGHIKARTDIEYQEQDKDMFQRLVSYKKSMDNLSKVREKLLALFQLTDNNLSKFKDPTHFKNIIEEFARELRGYNTPKNWFDRIFVRAYAQAMKTIVMPSPVLSIGRNLVLGQNMAIGHDKGMLIDPRNKTLTKDDIEFLDTFVIQQEFMKFEWFESREKPLPGMATITKLVEKCALYPWSDTANRYWSFWAKINQARRGFADIDKYSTEAQIEDAMWKTKFSDFALDEQMMAMDILAKDGVEAMERFIAKTYTDDVHFIYQRAQRAPAEMGRVGRIWGNLILWARAYWEKLFYHTGKVIGKDIPFKERWRGLEVLSNIIIGGLLVGAAYKKVTGRREAPYHPLNLLAYTPGGLQVGVVEAAGEVYANIILAVKGDRRAYAALATDLPHAADMFIPFYDYALRAVEASTDTKNIDIKALRKVRMMLDKEYKLRGGAYVVKRNAWERWQYFLAGAGVDVTIKEREKAEKEKGKFPTIKFPEKSKFTKPKFPKRP